MNMELAQMRIKLANLNQRRAQMMPRIERLCTVIRANLNTALTPVDELLVPDTAGHMDELVAAWGELQAVLAEIGRLEQELV